MCTLVLRGVQPRAGRVGPGRPRSPGPPRAALPPVAPHRQSPHPAPCPADLVTKRSGRLRGGEGRGRTVTRGAALSPAGMQLPLSSCSEQLQVQCALDAKLVRLRQLKLECEYLNIVVSPPDGLTPSKARSKGVVGVDREQHRPTNTQGGQLTADGQPSS